MLLFPCAPRSWLDGAAYSKYMYLEMVASVVSSACLCRQAKRNSRCNSTVQHSFPLLLLNRYGLAEEVHAYVFPMAMMIAIIRYGWYSPMRMKIAIAAEVRYMLWEARGKPTNSRRREVRLVYRRRNHKSHSPYTRTLPPQSPPLPRDPHFLTFNTTNRSMSYDGVAHRSSAN